MNYRLSFLFCTCFGIGFAQIPNGYYNNATATGYALKTQLYDIIKNHDDQGYNAIDNFFINFDLDDYYEMDSSILDIYSENPNGVDPYSFTPNSDECGQYASEGDCYNKEHIIPQSIFNSNNPMRGDAHQLFPTDGRVNGFRGNYPMGRVDDNNLISQSGISNPTQNGSKLGNNINSGYSAGYSGVVFEPIDEFKGDVARAHFYFATRYENLISNWNQYPMFDGSNDQVFEIPFLNILLEWHNSDPVSQKEIDRNNAIYYQHQSNRNPFVDHPEFVSEIWVGQQDNESPTSPTNLNVSNPTATTVDISWTAASDNVAVTNYDVYVDGVINTSVSAINVTVTGLSPETNYCFTVVARDAANNVSTPSNQACETTLSATTGNVDLFFSEYIEGSSLNKALEIANFTGSSVNLSNYSIKLSSNGNNTWTTTYSFPVNTSINNADVYVIANGSMSICTDVVDNQNNSITGFNGNDVLGLFKNENLIDIIGTLGNSQDFAENTTLVRNANISSGSTVFNSNEWSNYSSNTCDNLGTHSQTLGNSYGLTDELEIYPNPIKGSTLFIKASSQTTVTIYDLLGNRLLVKQLNRNRNSLSIDELSSGMYLVKLNNTHGSFTKKIIKE